MMWSIDLRTAGWVARTLRSALSANPRMTEGEIVNGSEQLVWRPLVTSL